MIVYNKTEKKARFFDKVVFNMDKQIEITKCNNEEEIRMKKIS